MTMRSMRSGLRLLLGLSLIAGATSAALADPVTAATRASSAAYSINLNNIPRTPAGSSNFSTTLNEFYTKIGGSGAYNDAANANLAEIRTYCVDLGHFLSGNPMNFTNATNTVTNNPSLGDGQTPTYFTRDMGRIGALLNVYGQTDALNVLTGANWTGPQLSGLTAVQQGAALQAAVWVAGFGVALADYTISGTNAALVKTAADYLVNWSVVKSASAGFVDYSPQNPSTNPGAVSQDQAYRVGGTVITAVPEPSTFAIAGLGALAFLGYGLRRRRAEGAAA